MPLSSWRAAGTIVAAGETARGIKPVAGASSILGAPTGTEAREATAGPLFQVSVIGAWPGATDSRGPNSLGQLVLAKRPLDQELTVCQVVSLGLLVYQKSV